MIVARLTGGLGNQMFQYSAARRLALHWETELKLDISAYLTLPDREYALAPFPIAATLADSEDVARLTTAPRISRIVRRLLRRNGRRPATHVREPDWSFHPEILELPDGVYLEGYWQSERYFRDAASAIRSELAPPTPTGPDANLARRIEGVNAVSVHVRRGDYVTSQVAQDTLGLCGLDYYERAAEHLTSEVSDPHAFLFSDDPEWTRANLRLPWPSTVVGEGEQRTAEQDLALMIRCRHHIIANSSFSWWGAWLAEGNESCVVAPRQWFARTDLSADDLVPDRWERL